MAKFFDHVIIGLAWVCAMCAGAYFCGPMIYRDILSAEQAVQTVKVQKAALAADTASSSAQQASCAAQISSAVKAGAAIIKASKVQPASAGTSQAMVTAADIAAMMQ